MPGDALTPGIFGKSPGHGDFLESGVSAGAASALHGWISGGLDALDAGRSLDLTRVLAFLSGPGVVGPDWCFGAMAGSCDRAGRAFLWTGLCEQPAPPEARWAIAVADGLARVAWRARDEPLDRALSRLAQAVLEIEDDLDHVDEAQSLELLDMVREGRIAAWSDEGCAVGRLSSGFFRDVFAMSVIASDEVIP